MKPLSKFLLQALSLMFLFSTSCYFPGTEKGNLRLLTMLYANREKTEGQKVRFGGIDRKDYQEVEGIRTDARVCNLSYLQTDWYIDQMKRPAYESPSVPIHWQRYQYVAGTREGVQVRPDMLERAIEVYKDRPELMKEMLGENPYELKNVIDKWILNPKPELQFFPTDSLVVTVDKEAVRCSGMMIAADSIPDVMHISLKGKRAVYKSEMMIYEMLAQCNWERPLYVAISVSKSNYGNLGDNFVQEGLANRITPFNTKQSGEDVR